MKRNRFHFYVSEKYILKKLFVFWYFILLSGRPLMTSHTRYFWSPVSRFFSTKLGICFSLTNLFTPLNVTSFIDVYWWVKQINILKEMKLFDDSNFFFNNIKIFAILLLLMYVNRCFLFSHQPFDPGWLHVFFL